MAFLLMRYGLYESGNVLLRTRLCLSLWELSGCTTSTHYSWQMTQVAHRPGNLAFPTLRLSAHGVSKYQRTALLYANVECTMTDS
ncbi:hypothetical protein GQ600_7300 [Phytophthora cactorum]|nr:hypothetical protein GQ600_7300 [Phytophthora cactorum]